MRALAWVGALLLVGPLALVDVPPLVDYPNHLARIFLLARGAGDPALAPMFVTNWGVLPNLFVDVVGPPLLWLLPAHVGGRLLLAIVLLLPYAGALALHRAAFGSLSAWAVLVALILPAGAFALGFLNFVAGCGLALLGAAWWLRAGRARAALGVLWVGGLFFAHLMGMLFWLGLVGAMALADGLRTRRMGPLLELVPALLVARMLYGLAPLNAVADAPVFLGAWEKVAQLQAPFAAYVPWLDGATLGIVGATLGLAAATRRIAAPAWAWIALAGLLAVYAVTPYAWKGTMSLDTRFVLMAAMLVFAGLRPRLPVAALALLGAVLLARTAAVGVAYWEQRAVLADVRAALAPVGPGETMFIAAGPARATLSSGVRTDAHLGALAVVERRAFYPLLFDEPTQQPVLLTEGFQRLADANGSAIDPAALRGAALCGYRHLLLLAPAGEIGGSDLALEVGRPWAALYRVTRRCAAG